MIIFIFINNKQFQYQLFFFLIFDEGKNGDKWYNNIILTEVYGFKGNIRIIF